MSAPAHSWDQLLKLAQELKRWSDSNVCEETRQRSATSRAYYAAFCSARNYLRDVENEIPPTDGTAHGWVPSQLQVPKGPMDRERAEVARWLNRLRRRRNRADYDDVIPPPDSAANDSVQALLYGKKILQHLSKLQRPSSPCSDGQPQVP